MKFATLTLMLTMVIGCSGSNGVARSVYGARDRVDAAGARVHAKVRPAVRPVAASVDRNVERAVASIGLAVEPSKN